MTAADQIVRSAKKVLAMEGRPHMTTQSGANRSRGKFPANREFYREFYENRVVWRKSARKTQQNQLVAGEFPTKRNRELIRPNREFIKPSREFRELLAG
jgi:hypothetical protein